MADERPAMSRERYVYLKQILTKRRRELFTEVLVRRLAARGPGTNPQDVGGAERHGDLTDMASSAIQVDVDLAIIQMKTDTLRQIERALARLDEGTFGYCFACDEEISDQRLRALPLAVRCKSCEEAHEIAEKRESRGRK